MLKLFIYKKKNQKLKENYLNLAPIREGRRVKGFGTSYFFLVSLF